MKPNLRGRRVAPSAVHFFASTKNKGQGLFPWDEYVENPDDPGVELWGAEKIPDANPN